MIAVGPPSMAGAFDSTLLWRTTLGTGGGLLLSTCGAPRMSCRVPESTTRRAPGRSWVAARRARATSRCGTSLASTLYSTGTTMNATAAGGLAHGHSWHLGTGRLPERLQCLANFSIVGELGLELFIRDFQGRGFGLAFNFHFCHRGSYMSCSSLKSSAKVSKTTASLTWLTLSAPFTRFVAAVWLTRGGLVACD